MAKSGKTFGSVNPTTGEALDEVVLRDAPNVHLAVAAARRAFAGSWGRSRPAGRHAILLKLANLLEKHSEELALIDALDMRVPLSFARYTVTRPVVAMAQRPKK